MKGRILELLVSFATHNMDVKKYHEKFAGQDLSVEVGRLANQANGSVFVQ